MFLFAKRPRKGLAIPYSGWLIAAALANLVFWSVITFGPYETQTAHSSYADILLLSVGLLSFILTLPRIVFLLLLHGRFTIVLWLGIVTAWTNPNCRCSFSELTSQGCCFGCHSQKRLRPSNFARGPESPGIILETYYVHLLMALRGAFLYAFQQLELVREIQRV